MSFLTRRNALRAMGAGTLAAPLALTQAPPQRKGFHATGVNHVSYVAPDFRKTRDWYHEVFGMEISFDDGKQAYMWFGDAMFIPRQARPGEEAPRIDHFAFTIDNFNKAEVAAELRRRGMDPREDTDLSFHVREPEGYDIQICSKDLVKKPAPSVSRPSLWRATSVNHVGFISADYGKARDWYKDLFDLRLSHDSGTDCYEWMGDTVWSPRQGRPNDNRTGYIDHIAYTIENFDKEAVGAELEKRGLKPRIDTDLSYNCVDINGFKCQICDRELVPTAEKRPPAPGRGRG